MKMIATQEGGSEKFNFVCLRAYIFVCDHHVS